MARAVNPAERPPAAARSLPTRGGPARRRAILDAALRLFRERGFHGTSINDIGTTAGVTGPALYRHFSGKGEVLAEAIRDGARRIAAATRPAVENADLPPREALAELVRAYVGVALDNADTHAAYVLESRHLDDEARRPLRRKERGHRDEWRRLLMGARPELDAEQARVLVRMAIFSVTALCMEPRRLDRDALVELASSRVLALLLAEAPAAGR